MFKHFSKCTRTLVYNCIVCRPQHCTVLFIEKTQTTSSRLLVFTDLACPLISAENNLSQNITPTVSHSVLPPAPLLLDRHLGQGELHWIFVTLEHEGGKNKKIIIWQEGYNMDHGEIWYCLVGRTFLCSLLFRLFSGRIKKQVFFFQTLNCNTGGSLFVSTAKKRYLEEWTFWRPPPTSKQ